MEELLSPGLLQELKRIELRTRRLVDTDLMGAYRTSFRGSGLEFADLREYSPGDDVRHINWKVTARTGRVFVKSFHEERHQRIVLAVDSSRSTQFGPGRQRGRLALELAAAIALLARVHHDSIGLCTFSDDIHDFLPAKASRSQYYRVLRTLASEPSIVNPTNLGTTLRSLYKKCRRTSTVFLISDFLSPHYTEDLQMVALKHDLICVMLSDRFHENPPAAGLVEFTDAETGERHIIDLSSRAVRTALRDRQQAHEQQVRQLAKSCGASFVILKDSPVHTLQILMHERLRGGR